MNPNKQSDIQQLLGNKKALQQVARSREAKALAGMLTQGRDQASLQRAAEKAAKGDTAELNALIQSVMNSPGGAELMRRLNESLEKQ